MRRAMSPFGASHPLPRVLARVLDRTDSSHATVTAATALYAPQETFTEQDPVPLHLTNCNPLVAHSAN